MWTAFWETWIYEVLKSRSLPILGVQNKLQLWWVKRHIISIIKTFCALFVGFCKDFWLHGSYPLIRLQIRRLQRVRKCQYIETRTASEAGSNNFHISYTCPLLSPIKYLAENKREHHRQASFMLTPSIVFDSLLNICPICWSQSRLHLHQQIILCLAKEASDRGQYDMKTNDHVMVMLLCFAISI